jgi:hypothetical protein
MSRKELASKAFVSGDTVGVWERSSAAVVTAKPALMNRAIAALEAAGVTFTDDGVRLQRPAQVSTTLHSEEVAL